MDIETVTPLKPRYLIEDLGNSLRITTGVGQKDIGGRILLVFFIVYGVIIGAMLCGMVFVLSKLSGDFSYSTPLYMLLMGVIMGLFLSLLFLWRFTFKEIISVEHDAITVSHQSIPFTQTKRYLAAHIRDLRASPIPPTAIWVGTIAFDYGSRTLFFGSRISEAEAKQIVRAIQQKFERYKS